MILFKFFILGVTTALLFPPFFMLPLGLMCFPLLVNSLTKIVNKTLFGYFYCGFFYGLGFLLIFLSWIYSPFLIFNSTKHFAILATLLPLFLSFFFGLGFCIYKYADNNFLKFLLTPFILIIIEFTISNIFYGFPWISFSLILSNNFIGFYFLKYFGIYTSGFLVLLLFISPTLFIFNNKFKNKKYLILILILPFLFGSLLCLYFFELKISTDKKEINLEVHQIVSSINNIDREKTEEDIINIIINSKSDYIIFAENNYPYLISDTSIINLSKYVKNNQKIIIGATRKEDNKFYNSFIYLEDGNSQYFDKKILVPFGEFLPFRNILKFMELIVGSEDLTSGKKNRLISTNEDINILPVICYEIIFNEIFKNINKKNIDLLINLTNDSWFGSKVGPYQHFYLTRIRSLISNKPLVRVSNNGISAIINENGQIIKYLNLNQKNNFKYKLKINNKTYHYLIHNIFLIYLILFFSIILIFRNNKYIYED